VWWRRPEVPVTAEASGAADAIADQWRAFFAALANVPGPTWVSDPKNIRAAEDKARQLRQARAAGLAVPDTLWTNDLDDARIFIERWDGTAVVKSIASAWWEEKHAGHFVFSSLITADDLPEPQRLASAPVCIQQPITPKRDVRVTVVNKTVLAAIREDRDEHDAPLDWRLADQRPWLPYELPPDVADACRVLVSDLGLLFSGIDFALGDAGKHWFLELNPNGEWGWLQRAGLPIAEALADTLLTQQR
jgi:glutathione synthase/RimK-type ligase-like ATP-grasp enzyme